MEQVVVKVPATTANLGPGFDTVGCAVELYATYTFTKNENGSVRVKDTLERYQNDKNLAIIAFKQALKYMGVPFCGVDLVVNSDIPISRGLGSSAATIVGGVLAANAFCNNKMTMEECLQIATELEGHPDNIAPALYGGLTASFMDGKVPHCAKYQISDRWHFTALVPDFKLSTPRARSALPRAVSIRDAVYNISRTAVTLKALEMGDDALLRISLNDRLHQPYRKVLIPEYSKVESIAKGLNASAVYLSGAGPTILCISTSAKFSESIRKPLLKLRNKWQVIPLNVEKHGAQVTVK